MAIVTAATPMAREDFPDARLQSPISLRWHQWAFFAMLPVFGAWALLHGMVWVALALVLSMITLVAFTVWRFVRVPGPGGEVSASRDGSSSTGP